MFYATKAELMRHLEGQDKEVFSVLLDQQNGREIEFDYAFEMLFCWCQNTLKELDILSVTS